MPDLSLLIPLCDILNISINDLLSGEKVTKEDYQKKLEENIIKINITNVKRTIKKSCKIVIITLLSIVLFISLVIILLFAKQKYDNKRVELDSNKVSFNMCTYNNLLMLEAIYYDNMPVLITTLNENDKVILKVYRQRKYYNNPKLYKKEHIGNAKYGFDMNIVKEIYFKDKLIWNKDMNIDACN